MNDSADAVSIRVLDREYTVGVKPEERDSLMAAARLLDQQMREIRGANRMAAIDRVAVLAALNFAHELELLRNARKGHDRELAATIDSLQRKLDTLLAG
ncbi:MAG TPA: cell division protein ZapA [Lysobacter sp.]|nr:cell division protein ZapA [Lysobacter sp.]